MANTFKNAKKELLFFRWLIIKCKNGFWERFEKFVIYAKKMVTHSIQTFLPESREIINSN